LKEKRSKILLIALLLIFIEIFCAGALCGASV